MPVFSKTNYRQEVQELFIQYYDSLLSFAGHYVDREVAEDVVQEVFVKIWEEHKRILQMEDVSAYMYQMVRFRCLNFLRAEKTKHKMAQYLSEEEWTDTETDLFTEEESYRKLILIIEKLPPVCKTILTLGMEGLKSREIAEKLNIAVSTVKKQKQIARRILREKMLSLLLLIKSVCS